MGWKIKIINKFLFVFFLSVLIISCGNHDGQDLLKKARAFDTLGETDSAIVYLKEYLIQKPNDLNVRLELVKTYQKVKEYDRAKIICNNTIFDSTISNNMVLMFSEAYKIILFDEYYIYKDKLEKAIKNLNSVLALKISNDLWQCVNALPIFNLELLEKRDSTFKKKLTLINPITTEYDWDIYELATVFCFISKKLFDEKSSDFIPGIYSLAVMTPPPKFKVESYKNRKIPIYDGVEKDVFQLIAEYSNEFGQHFFDVKKWKYAVKCFELAKTFHKKFANNGWSIAAMEDAYNEAISYGNDGQYKLAYQKLNDLVKDLPNVDEIMEENHKEIYKLFKKSDPNTTYQRLKPVKQLMEEYKRYF